MTFFLWFLSPHELAKVMILTQKENFGWALHQGR